MTAKQQQALETILAALPEDMWESGREVAEYAVSLGYMPAIKGVRKDYADFTKSKVKRTILKINTDPNFCGLGMKFYAIPAYTGIFADAIAMRLRYWDKLGYEARCFGCGHCDGTHGYKCTLPDGRAGFLCGWGVLPLPAFRAEHIPAIKEALRVQDAFFVAEQAK
jgi:hypothetical protein